MNRISTWRLTATLALMFALSGFMGCAQDVGDIDRTQPDKLKKELFQTDDEWFLQQTVIDTEMEGSSMAFAALESDLKRIRWTLTEDVLYAHSAMELADGLNEGFDEEDARRNGVVAAFPIRDHFDVQRQYSAATGEPTNVIVENRSDRPWYDREYMRVDWTTNMVDGFRMFHGQLGQFTAVSYNPPQDDAKIDPNRTRISDDYIDTVTEYSYQPDLNACFSYGLDAVWSCEGGRIKARTAIQRVPDEETYLPLNYTDSVEITRDGTESGEPLMTSNIFDRDLGYRVEVECDQTVRDWMLDEDGSNYEDRCQQATFDFHQRFGYFRTERITWDRYAGSTEYGRRYWVNRWNIWQTMVDEDGERLDEQDRIPQPITYYLNVDYPKFMFDAAQETAVEWNDTFRETVKLSMGISGHKLDQLLEDEYGHTEMFRIVENSCHPGPLVEWFNTHGQTMADDRRSATDIFDDYAGTTSGDETMEAALWSLSNEARQNLCANLEYATEPRANEEQRFSWERFGDLRYSFFAWHEESVPWAGYGPSSADPKTGEIIRGNANFAGGYIRRMATYAADLVQYMNGELSDDDIISGAQIRADLFDRDRDSDRFGLSPEGQEELAMRASVNPSEMSDSNFGENPDLADLDPFIHRYGLDRIQREAHIVSESAHRQASRDKRMVEFLENPTVKNFMLGDVETDMAIQASARGRFGDDYNEEQFHQAYLDVHTPRMHYERSQEQQRLLMERNILTNDTLAHAAESLVTYKGVTDFFKGKDRADIMEFFMNQMFIGTQLHEIGHTVGLRHNFSSHADALNYHDEYWEIERLIHAGELTREEAESIQGQMARDISGDDDVNYLSQSEFKLASAMDYTADLTGRFAGLGKYDRAAIKFAYGEMVQQWDSELELSTRLDSDSFIRDYRDLPLIIAEGIGQEENAYDAGIDVLLNEREYVPIRDAMEHRRAGIISNTEDWIDYEFSDDKKPVVDRTVSYNFCSDEFAGRRLNCAVRAYGGNQQEMVQHAFDTFRAFQVFYRYSRHNIDRNYENLQSYYGRLNRTFDVSMEPFRYYSIYRWFNLGDYTEDLQRAAIDGFNFYNEVMATPEPGRYCKFDANRTRVDAHWYHDLENTYVPARFHSDAGDCTDYFDIELGEGFDYNFSFTPEYTYRIDRVGTFIDKIVASQQMFTMSADFAQSAFFTDRRATNLSYWTVFKDEMLQMMSGVILGDYSDYGPAVDGGELVYPNPIDVNSFGHGTADPNGDHPRIFTPQSANHELNILAGGMIYNSSWDDRQVDFTHYVKVSTSDDERQEYGEGIDVAEFVHPITHQVYQAPDVEGRSVGVKMIERANELGTRFEYYDDILQQVESGTNQYYTARSDRDLALEQMQDIVAKMDMTRFVIEATRSLR